VGTPPLREHLIYGRADELTHRGALALGKAVKLTMLLLGKVDLGTNHGVYQAMYVHDVYTPLRD
jgi:hypothetical protein